MQGTPSSPDNDFLRWTSAFRRFLMARLRKGGLYGLEFTIAFFSILLLLFVFLFLASGVMNEGIVGFDERVSVEAARYLDRIGTTWVVGITDLGGTRGTVIGATLVGLFLLFHRRWWGLFGLIIATAGGGLVLRGLKAFFARARPLEMLVPAAGYAFPSGHAFAAMVFFGYLIYLSWMHVHTRSLRLLIMITCSLLIVMIALSRVLLNVHWFTDVVGGLIAGLAWLIACILIIRHVEHTRVAP